MPKIVKDLLLSKKFVVALLTGGGAVAAYLGWSVDPTRILLLVSPFLAYIGAQGWADAGKEKQAIASAAQLQVSKMSLEHSVLVQKMSMELEVNMRKLPQAGFARLGTLVVVGVLGLGLSFACVRAGQVALKTGQCVLDNGVLGDVLVALEQPNYLQAVEALAVTDASELINCALQAVMSQPGAGSGSGSGSEELPRVLAPAATTLPQRAREVLSARRAAGK